MKFSKFVRIFILAIFMASFFSLSHAQGTGEFGGKVTDDEGAPLPGVNIIATHLQTGTTIATISAATGSFRLTNLRAGTYEITYELEGFAKVIKTGIDLRVGQNIVINTEMEMAALGESITVTAEAPVIEATKSRLQGIVSKEQVLSLPLEGRNWVELATLVPGVRATPGEWSPIRVGAGNSSDVSYNMDGSDISCQWGGEANVYYSQEAIEEFQVITTRFDAKYGRQGGGVLNAITKSGTNIFHGSIYGYFRNDKFGDAKDFFTEEREEYGRRQMGGQIGGPIIRDKAHFFLSLENFFLGDKLSSGTGIPYLDKTVDGNRNESYVTARIDANLSSRFRLLIRGSGHKKFNGARGVGGSRAYLGQGERTDLGGDFVIGATYQISNRMVNRTTLMTNHFFNDIYPLYKMPQHVFPSATIGPATNAEQYWKEKNYGVRTDFDLFIPDWMGEHDVKWGAEIYRPRFLGDFSGTKYGSYYFSEDPTDFLDSETYPQADTYTVGMGEGSYDVKVFALGAYIQDDWSISDRLTLNFGLRWDLETMNDEDDPRRAPYVTTQKTEYGRFGPRFGFIYDLFRDGKTLIRGGIGRYTGRHRLNEIFTSRVYDGWSRITPTVSNPDYDDPLGGKTIEDFRAEMPPTYIRVYDRDLRNPYFIQTSIGVGQELTSDVSLMADFVYIMERGDDMRVDANLFRDEATNTPLSVDIYGRPDPRFTQVGTLVSVGKSDYYGLQCGFTKRYSGGYMLQASYTLSWSYDNKGGPNNPFDIDDEWSWSSRDQRHRLVVSGIVDLPLGVQLSGIFYTASAYPIGISSPIDAYDDQWRSGQRILADGTKLERNSERGESIYKLDLRLTKWFRISTFKIEGFAEGFNILNTQNNGSFGGTWGTGTYLQPRRTTNATYRPRKVQLGFRITF